MILCAGLTPAWQGILVFDELKLGEVNRARESHWSASGKVLNAARAAHRLSVGAGGRGGPSRALTLLGGAAGEAMVAALAAEGIETLWVQSDTPSRVCTTVIDSSDGSITELVEDAGPVSERDLGEFQEIFHREAAFAQAVVLTGSLPRSTPTDFYRRLLQGTSAPAVIDARGEELLLTLELRPFLVKPNREELSRTLGRPLRSEEDLRAAILELSRRGARWVLVSQGRDAVWVYGEGEFHRFRPPRVQAVNPIGSGDCLAAGIAHATTLGEDPLEAILAGIACAAENAAVLLPADIDPRKVERRRAEVTVDRGTAP